MAISFLIKAGLECFGFSGVSFAVLYGPPAMTRIAIEHLRNVPGLSLFGRIFKPDEVDFGPNGPSWEGLTPGDIHIRAMDKPLYLSRIIQRAAGFPIIQISPGDDRDVEGALRYYDKAVFLPCVPRHFDHEEWRYLYWVLTALAHPKGAVPGFEHRNAEENNYHFLREMINRHMQKFTLKEHCEWVAGQVFNEHDNKNMIHLYFDTGSREARSHVNRQPEKERERERNFRDILVAIGPTILPLLGAIDSLSKRLSGLAPRELLDNLPPSWQPRFRPVLEPLPRPTPAARPHLSVIARRFAANAED